jgi:hypothetical protein
MANLAPQKRIRSDNFVYSVCRSSTAWCERGRGHSMAFARGQHPHAQPAQDKWDVVSGSTLLARLLPARLPSHVTQSAIQSLSAPPSTHPPCHPPTLSPPTSLFAVGVRAGLQASRCPVRRRGPTKKRLIGVGGTNASSARKLMASTRLLKSKFAVGRR